MSAARTLARRRTKERVTLPDGQVVFADLPAKPRRVKPGTKSRSVSVIRQPVGWYPYWVTFHATKGWRRRRASQAEIAELQQRAPQIERDGSRDDHKIAEAIAPKAPREDSPP